MGPWLSYLTFLFGGKLIIHVRLFFWAFVAAPPPCNSNLAVLSPHFLGNGYFFLNSSWLISKLVFGIVYIQSYLPALFAFTYSTVSPWVASITLFLNIANAVSAPFTSTIRTGRLPRRICAVVMHTK